MNIFTVPIIQIVKKTAYYSKNYYSGIFNAKPQPYLNLYKSCVCSVDKLIEFGEIPACMGAVQILSIVVTQYCATYCMC